MTMLVVFGTMAILLFLSVPIAISIGLSVVVGLLYNGMPLLMAAQNCFTAVDSFALMGLPFYMLCGTLMVNGGTAQKLVDFAKSLVGWVTGSLGFITTLSCMFFGAISGSAPGTTAAIGSIMVPAMKNGGYKSELAAAIISCSGTIGVIIPPSIPFVIYGVASGASVADMFLAGIIPGIIIGLGLMVVCFFMARKERVPREETGFSLKRVFTSFWDAKWAILVPVIILGGIYSGIFTPTESAVVAVVYCVIVSVFVYHEFNLKDVYASLYDSVNVNGMTTFMVGFSMAFAAYLTMERIPDRIAEAILSLTDSKILLLLLINLLLLGVGCLIDNIPATIILAPILLPIVEQFGMDPITFGIMLTMNLAIGFVTPPYGIDLFVASAISKEPMSRMIKPTLRFILALLVVLMLVTFCEPLTMGVLNLVKGA